jgi:hypothetical protein
VSIVGSSRRYHTYTIFQPFKKLEAPILKKVAFADYIEFFFQLIVGERSQRFAIFCHRKWRRILQ